jgi:hypothetical protein
MALLLLTVTRGDLLDAWRRAFLPRRRTALSSISSPNRSKPVRAALVAQGLSPSWRRWCAGA